MLAPNWRAGRSRAAAKSALAKATADSLRFRMSRRAEAARQRRGLEPLAGLEPARCFHHLILSQARLPIPPQGQSGGIIATARAASTLPAYAARAQDAARAGPRCGRCGASTGWPLLGIPAYPGGG